MLNTEWAQVEVIDLINDGSGLAFGIIGGRSTGVVVKTILPGGVADRDGRLQSGDHILQIGEVNLRGLGSEQVASVLRQCGVHVRMVVARPVESTTDNQALCSHAPIVPTKILGDPVELDRHLIENGFAGTCAPIPPVPYIPLIYEAQNPISDIVDVVRNPLPIGKIPIPKICPPPPPLSPPLPESAKFQDLPETETFTLELKKDDLGLGITVAGYVCEKEEISGIFVKSISKGSAADAKKMIKVNDRIIEVNETSVIGYTNHQAVEFLKNTGPLVKIKFERYLRGPKYEQLQLAIKANELRPPSPPSPTVSSLPKVPLSLVHTSYLGIEPEGESRTSIDFDSTVLFDTISPIEQEREIVIGDRKSAQFSTIESIYEKWKNKIDKNAQIIIAQMHKTENSGLGISLEGTVDVEDGKEVRPHHYIRNILPDGPVGQNGTLQSGDELLEVNAIQLLGLNHLEVVAILKQLPTFVNLVCARYPVPIRIIDTSQHPDAFQARKILAGSLQTLISSDHPRLVKAKSESSIASSIDSEALTTSRSRSLELIAGLPMWSDEPSIVELNKGDHGLGFSILDYQDPLNPQETVIVIRSLVPGGVAQADGRLIPGDRLLAVNDINLGRASLDTAVQVLKGIPKGPVKIAVAKPLNGTGDAVSYTSQETEDDHTGLEDFQECIEEFQEDLITVPIFIEDEHSFNHSPPTSQVEDFGQKNANHHNHVTSEDIMKNNYLNVNELNRDSIGDSDIDISFKSTNDNYLDHGAKNGGCDNNIRLILRHVQKADSLTQSEKPSLSDKDGYETCIDESLSEEPTSKTVQNLDNNVNKLVEEVFDVSEDITPTNSKVDLSKQFCPISSAKNQVPSSSEPCLPNTEYFPVSKHIYLDSKLEELKHYRTSKDTEADEFFLVQCPTNPPKEIVCKCVSEPIVLDDNKFAESKLTYKLREYYNDYKKNCVDAYKNITEYEKVGLEMTDSQIFDEIIMPFKSRSVPNITNRSFVTLTYDPGPDFGRRKSAFVAGYGNNNDSEMTVVRHIEPDYGSMKLNQDNVLHKHWGSTHLVKIYREPNKGLGISIVGGKVDVPPAEKQTDSFLGIFVKKVEPGSPAGKTGQFKTGDRILEVSGIDLREATHDKAVESIRKAPNPVVFLIQSLIPWTNLENEHDKNNSQSKISLRDSQMSIGKPLENHDETTEPQENFKPSSSETIKDNHITQSNDYYSGSENDEELDTIEQEGTTTSKGGHQIDRASAANIRRTKEEAAADKEQEDEFGYTTTLPALTRQEDSDKLNTTMNIISTKNCIYPSVILV